ncbi:MAG: hypothetical protein ACREFP_02820 [Acetobacteraceae bacterium]
MATPSDSIPIEAARRIAEHLIREMRSAAEEAQAAKLAELLAALAETGLDERAPKGDAR